MNECRFCGEKLENTYFNRRKFCNSICRDRERYPRKHKKYIERMQSDPDFHKQELEKFKKRNHSNYRQNKEYMLSLNKKSYLKNRDSIIKKMKQKYAERVSKLKKDIGDKFCVECDNKINNKCYNISDRFRFCSDKCSYVNWNRNNLEYIKKRGKVYHILNSEKISSNGKKYRMQNPIRKKMTDENYYKNNYSRIRMMSRIREILNGKFPHDYSNQEEILLKDIFYLKQAIKELEIENGELT